MKTMIRRIISGILVAGFVLAAGGSLVYAEADPPVECKPGQNLSEVLGMSWQAIWAEIQTGTTLKDLFTTKGLDYSDYEEQVLANRLSCVDQALANGKITKIQAERLKKVIQTRSDEGKLFLWGNRHDRMKLQFMPTLDELAEVFEMDPGILKTALNDGKNLAEIADQQGLEIETVYAKWVDLRTSILKDAIASGELDHEKGQQLIDRLQQNLADGKNFGDWTLPEHDFFSKREILTFITARDLVQTLFEAIDMTPAEIRESLANGQTIQELVAEKGIDADMLYHDWLNAQITFVNQKLSDGKLTQIQADVLLKRLNAQLDQPFPWEALRGLFRKGMRGHEVGEHTFLDVLPTL